jgi:hypothetical protein
MYFQHGNWRSGAVRPSAVLSYSLILSCKLLMVVIVMEQIYHTIVHFDIPAENVEKMRKFYLSEFSTLLKSIPPSLRVPAFNSTLVQFQLPEGCRLEARTSVYY